MKHFWKVDDFDWGIFGFRVAKITEIDSSGTAKALSGRIETLKKELVKNKVAYATHRVLANNFPMIHALEQAGFILIDGLISLSLDLSSMEPKKKGFKANQPGGLIREAKKSDLSELKEITTNLYSNTRITNDPLTRGRANEYYKKWIENSVNGSAADAVLVWEADDEILGYVTLQKKVLEGTARRGSAPEGQIPLIGVSEQARGKGIGSKLLNAAFAKFKKWGVKKVNIDTQMGNIPALRAYQGVGFKISDSHLTFRWAP